MRPQTYALDRAATGIGDHYLVVAKVRERLAVSKRMVRKMDMERFNLKQLSKEEVREQYQVTLKNKFAALEILNDNGDINRAWDTIRENIKISAKESISLCESKSHKPWFEEECLKLVDLALLLFRTKAC
jgi:hypothetical protein